MGCEPRAARAPRPPPSRGGARRGRPPSCSRGPDLVARDMGISWDFTCFPVLLKRSYLHRG